MRFDQRLIRFVHPSRRALLLSIACGFAAGILTVWQAWLVSRIIGRVFLAGQSLDDVAPLLALLLVLFGIRAGLVWAGEVTGNVVAVQVKTDLRRRLYAHLLALGPISLWHEDRETGARTGELTSLAVEGVEALDAYFSQYLPQVALAALLPLTYLAFVLPVDLLSAVVLFATAPLIPIFMILIGSAAEAVTKRQLETLNRLSAHFLDVLQGLTTLKILGRSRGQAQVIARYSERFRESTLEVLRVAFLSALALELVATLSTAVVAVEIGLRLLYGRMAFEPAFFVLLLAPEFYLPLRMLGTRFHAGAAGAAAAEKIFAILEKPAAAREAVRPEGVVSADLALHPIQSLRFEDVHFAYPGRSSALRGVSFELGGGHKTALVGPSGSGKSTAAALLLRFIEPQQGEIRVDGRPLGDLAPEAWRAQVAWVPQNPYLFHDTVLANIRLARPGASPEEVAAAARQANAHTFIERLPQGYDTVIGDRGARLSGGQAQRIALARAFLKDAPILILDEATANLDPELERSIQEAVDRLAVGRTTFVIAHRLRTICTADRILVLENGCLVESGSHAELIERDGLYRRLVSASLDEGSEPDGSPGELSSGSVRKLDEFASRESWPTAIIPDGAPAASRGAFRRLLNFVAPLKARVGLSVALGCATIASSIGLMSAAAYIISRAALQPSIAELQVAIVGVRFFGIARGVFRYLERYVTHQVTFHLLARLRVWFYQALEPLAPARLLSYRGGDLLSRAIGDIASLENFYGRALAPPLVAVLVGGGTVLFLSLSSPALGLSLLGLLLLAGLGVPLLIHRLSRKAGRRLAAERAALNAALVEGIQGLADLLAAGQGQRYLDQVSTAGEALGRSQKALARTGGLSSALMGLLASLGLWTVLVLAVPMVASGRIPGVHLAVLALAALTSFEAVLPLPAAAQTLESSLEAARRLFAITDAEPEVRSPAHPQPLPERFDLSVRGLRFAYPAPGGFENRTGLLSETNGRGVGPRPDLRRRAEEDITWILNGLDFELPAGKRLAVVGPSGSGKTTLVSLLLRFWDYSEGQILLAGKDLRGYDPDDLRDRIGVVSQSTHLFNATIRDNLLLAQPRASEADIVRAAELACIHDFIAALPDGYGTWIGEQGLRLSGGERQRLALARALLKDPPLLILDEPTANLDARTEQDVLQAIYTLMSGRTTVLITHRLTGLEAVDEVLVLSQGRVEERGQHAQLIAAGGLYQWMWEQQNGVLLPGYA